jgi:segregation and condensation protein B
MENGALKRMSLKAKLEAVIYAAEEPVTLAQLAGLFADEALEWKAEREAAAAQGVEPGADGGALPQLNVAFPHLELEPIESAGEAGAGDEAASEATVEADAEAEAKRAAKLREREARGTIKQVLDELVREYAADGRGIEIREIAGGYRMGTKPQCHDAVRMFVKSLKPAMKLSLPALETLAVIAYKQPVTAPEVNEIRGVDSSGVFGSLLARKLIVTAGRKPVVGRPILYKTTREFLLRFGLKDVSELPSMEEFEKMAASELDDEAAGAGDEIATEAAPEFDPDLSAETEEAASEEAAETNSYEDAQEKEKTAGSPE